MKIVKFAQTEQTITELFRKAWTWQTAQRNLLRFERGVGQGYQPVSEIKHLLENSLDNGRQRISYLKKLSEHGESVLNDRDRDEWRKAEGRRLKQISVEDWALSEIKVVEQYLALVKDNIKMIATAEKRVAAFSQNNLR